MRLEGDHFVHSTLDEGYDFHITDKWKKKFHFKIATFPVPSGYLSEAIEVVKDEKSKPYIFTILSDFEADHEHSELLLKAKIKRGINRRYLQKTESGLEISDDMELAGRIEWNDDPNVSDFDRVFVIDGKKITLEHFARMLGAYEGWGFKFKIYDRTEFEL